MKKLFLSLIAVVLLSGSSWGQETSKPTNRVVGWFSAGTFGCWGWNFCDGSAPWESNSQKTEGFSNTQVKNQDGTMTIVLDSNFFNEENKKFYAEHDYFVLTEDEPLDKNEAKSLGFKENAFYVAGKYPIAKNKNLLSITLKVDYKR